MHRSDQRIDSGCTCCAMNRRRFLAGCAACAAGGALALTPRLIVGGQTRAAKPRIQLVFLHGPADRPTWPHIGYDYAKRKQELLDRLTAACPGLELVPTTVMDRAQAEKLVADGAGVDGYLVYIVGLRSKAAGTILAAGKPTLLVDDLYAGCGEFLIENAAARRAARHVVGVSSSDLNDVIAAARGFEVLTQPGKTPADFTAAADAAWQRNVKRGDMKVRDDQLKVEDPAKVVERLRRSAILVVGKNDRRLIQTIAETFGTRVIPIDFKELEAFYDHADQDQAAEQADKWIKAAERMIEPKRPEIIKSAANYLAQKQLMKKYGAQGITINCLGGFYGGHMKAYPCLGFSQLNDDGLIGACEADLMSTMSMLIANYLTGRPGYISDPVMDTSRNRIIYAHCVAPKLVFGPQGPASSYHIRSHSEDRQGAVVRSLLPLGYMTTTVEFSPTRREVLLHQAKTVENVDEDKACRTKLAAEVHGNIDKLFNCWDQWRWHRVTFYGDGREAVQEMAKALKMKVVEEA